MKKILLLTALLFTSIMSIAQTQDIKRRNATFDTLIGGINGVIILKDTIEFADGTKQFSRPLWSIDSDTIYNNAGTYIGFGQYAPYGALYDFQIDSIGVHDTAFKIRFIKGTASALKRPLTIYGDGTTVIGAGHKTPYLMSLQCPPTTPLLSMYVGSTLSSIGTLALEISNNGGFKINANPRVIYFNTGSFRYAQGSTLPGLVEFEATLTSTGALAAVSAERISLGNEVIGYKTPYIAEFRPTATHDTTLVVRDSMDNIKLLITPEGTIGIGGLRGAKQGLAIGTSLGVKVDAITTTATLNLTHNYVLADATGGAFTITLPPAANAYSGGVGTRYVIKKIDATANIIVDGDGAETIDGAADVTLNTQYQSLTIFTNGTEWFIE